MSKELIERLRIFVADPVLGGVIEEATDRIEQLETELKTERCLSFRNQVAELEADRDKLREQVKMLRDALLTCSVGDFSTGHVIHPSFDEKLVEEALAATEPKL